MERNFKRRKRAVLDSVINKLDSERVLKFRLYAGRQTMSDRTHNVVSNVDYYSSNLLCDDGESDENDQIFQEVDVPEKHTSGPRLGLLRSFSDPTGALSALHSQGKFTDAPARETTGARHLVPPQNQKMSSLLETAGQLTWLHFLSESVKRQTKHRKSEPFVSKTSIIRRSRSTKLQEEERKLPGVFGKSQPTKDQEILTCQTVSYFGKRESQNNLAGEGHRSLKFVAESGKTGIAHPYKIKPKRVLANKQTPCSEESKMCYNSKLPPIHEGHPTIGSAPCSPHVKAFYTTPSPNINGIREDSVATSQKTHSSSNFLNHRGRSKPKKNRKVVFDVMSESSDDPQSLEKSDDNNVLETMTKRTLPRKIGNLKPSTEYSNVVRQDNDFPDIKTSCYFNKSATRLRKVGRMEKKVERRKLYPLPSDSYIKRSNSSRRYSMHTQTGWGDSASESSSESPEEETSAIKGGPGSFHIRRGNACADRKFSNTSMQVMGDASRPSITNGSGTLLTFEKNYWNPEVPDSYDYVPPALPERMVSFSSKINAWKATGPDIPRPRARTSGSLPSIMNTLFWPSPSGAAPTAVKTSQRSFLQQQQMSQQGRLFRRKSSFAAQTLASSRRLNCYRQSGDNLFPAIPKRPGLRRTLSQGDFSRLLTRKRFMPLVKFRRVVKMVLILLKATFNDREGGQRRERYLSLWASVLNGKFGNSRRAYEMYGISFDPEEFKANTEVQVSSEAKAILSLEPSQRSAQQLRQALASLRQAVEEFSEFPITMQESLARVGRYEHFEAKRVIIRQGHLAENFYFILSGTAVVTIVDIDKQTGEQTSRTAAFLGKGKSFGELALMHKSRRTATVRCQEDVELLAVGREDFVDIFMHVDGDAEPEHVRFLRGLHVLRGWPVEVLPANKPMLFLFTYVRRGVVLCKDSNTSDWIFVIKSGSCRVIKALTHRPAHAQKNMSDRNGSNKNGKDTKIGKTASSLTTLPVLAPLPSISQSQSTARRREKRKRPRHIPGINLSADTMEQVSLEHYNILDTIHRLQHGCSLSGKETAGVSEPSPRSESTESEKGDSVLEARTVTLANSTVFVDLLTLLPGDIYGLESCVFRSMGSKTTSTSLVSAGAEVIMINRKFFLDHTSEQLRKRIRREIRPLPSEETLQSKLETKISWEAFRHDTLQATLQLRQKNLHTTLV